MTILCSYSTDPDVFVVQARDAHGVTLTTVETSDLAVTLREVHLQLVRMRHLAKGKTFETPQPRSGA